MGLDLGRELLGSQPVVERDEGDPGTGRPEQGHRVGEVVGPEVDHRWDAELREPVRRRPRVLGERGMVEGRTVDRDGVPVGEPGVGHVENEAEMHGALSVRGGKRLGALDLEGLAVEGEHTVAGLGAEDLDGALGVHVALAQHDRSLAPGLDVAGRRLVLADHGQAARGQGARPVGGPDYHDLGGPHPLFSCVPAFNSMRVPSLGAVPVGSVGDRRRIP